MFIFRVSFYPEYLLIESAIHPLPLNVTTCMSHGCDLFYIKGVSVIEQCIWYMLYIKMYTIHIVMICINGVHVFLHCVMCKIMFLCIQLTNLNTFMHNIHIQAI